MTYVPTAIGLDIFQGGFTLGVQRAGFDLACNLEEGDFGNKTFKANFPDTPVHIGADMWPIDEIRRQDIDFMYSNPPCVVFSAAALAKKSTWRNKAELSCTLLSFDTFDRVQPAVFIWECVPRAWTMGRELVDEMTERALRNGYSVTYLLQDAVVLGVPQRRRRFMFIAHMVELDPWLPLNPVIHTVRDAIKGMEPNYETALPPSLANALRHSEATTGSRRDLRATWDEINLSNLEEGEARPKGRPKMMDHRVDWDKPCSTITGMVSHIHPEEERYLAPNEIARLCGYPDDFKWVYRNPTDFQQQCCKAVLPNVGEYAASVVMAGLEKGTLTSNRVQIFDFRKWADWQVARQIGGQLEPEPQVRLTAMPFQRGFVEAVLPLAAPKQVLRGGTAGGGKTARVKAEAAALLAASASARVTLHQPPSMSETSLPDGGSRKKTSADYPIRVVGYDEKGPIRSRNPVYGPDGKAVRQRVGVKRNGA